MNHILEEAKKNRILVQMAGREAQFRKEGKKRIIVYVV